MGADHLYRVLGVSTDASQDEIKQAFRSLAVRYHPDISKDPDAHSKFSEMTAAYNVLSDPQKRATYDLERTKAPPPDIMRSHINKMDPLYETMRRHQEQQAKSNFRSTFWNTHEEWQELKQHWEQQKQDSTATKQRRQRMDQRMKLAHAHRVAHALAGQWPAHFGITRQDVLATFSFAATMSCIAWYWVGPHATGGGSEVDVEAPQHVSQAQGGSRRDECGTPE